MMRALAANRSFARFLERSGQARAPRFAAVRGPKVPQSLPKPLVAPAAGSSDAATRAGEDREPWVLARDAAVLALLYGCGLRISEALSLHRAARTPGRRRRPLTRRRQGRQDAASCR